MKINKEINKNESPPIDTNGVIKVIKQLWNIPIVRTILSALANFLFKKIIDWVKKLIAKRKEKKKNKIK